MIQEIFDECTAGKHRDKWTITGKTIYDYCKAPFSVWCDYFAPAEEREPANPYLHLLSDRARKQKKLLFKKVGVEPLEFRSFTDGFKKALELMKKGEKKIANAPLFFLSKNLVGICDVLVRDDSAGSRFGQYHYKPLTIKNAKRMKYDYMVQTAFYNYLIGLVQEYEPKEFMLMNKTGKKFYFEHERFKDDLMKALDGIRAIQRGEEVKATAKTCKWPWAAYCTRKAIEAGDVSIIPMIGPVLKKELNEQGIMTVEQLAKAKLDIDLPQPMIDKIKKHAQAYVEKKPQIIEKSNVKDSDVEIFVDIEGTDEIELDEGVVKIDFLVGVILNEKGKQKYIPFISKDLKGEKKLYKELFEFLKKYEGAPIYHYGPHERLHFKMWAEQLGEKTKLNMIDLLSIVRNCTAFPTISQSLKDIAGYLGYKWRGTVDAQETIVLYLQYLETKDESLLQKIMEYNEDDCMATQVIKDFLAKSQ